MIVCCTHFETDRDEVLGGQAKLLYHFKTCQATLASCVSHSTNKTLLLGYAEGESKVTIVLLVDAHSEPDIQLGFGPPLQSFLGGLIEDVMVKCGSFGRIH